MQWFGPAAWAPVCDEDNRTEPPLGVTCIHCGEPVDFGDSGFVVPLVSAAAPAVVTTYHRECWLVGIAGPPAHLLGHCGCGRFTRNTAIPLPDPKTTSARDEARWVWKFIQNVEARMRP